jgi:hypothetical protein
MRNLALYVVAQSTSALELGALDYVKPHVFSNMVKECAREIQICEEDMYTTRHNHVQFAEIAKRPVSIMAPC